MYSGTASSCSPNTLLITRVVAGFIDLGPANIHTRAFLHPVSCPIEIRQAELLHWFSVYRFAGNNSPVGL